MLKVPTVDRRHCRKREPREYTRFSLSVQIEQADAGRDGRTFLAGPNFSGATGDKRRKKKLSSRPRAGLATIPVDSYFAICDDHPYIHIYTYR